jgi:hypothetical protein
LLTSSLFCFSLGARWISKKATSVSDTWQSFRSRSDCYHSDRIISRRGNQNQSSGPSTATRA